MNDLTLDVDTTLVVSHVDYETLKLSIGGCAVTLDDQQVRKLKWWLTEWEDDGRFEGSNK